MGQMERVRLNGRGAVVSYSVIHEAPAQYAIMKP